MANLNGYGTSLKDIFAGNPQATPEHNYWFSLGAHFVIQSVEDMVRCLTDKDDVADYVLTLLNKIKEE